MLYRYRVERLRAISISPSFECEINDISQTVSDLNKWGSDGWELVSVVPAGTEWLAFLKKPVR